MYYVLIHCTCRPMYCLQLILLTDMPLWTSAVVSTVHCYSDQFSTTSGVPQGDMLAPIGTYTLLDYVLCETLLETFVVSLCMPQKE